MTTTLSPRRQRGVSLIEVLVAVLIFSIGMIGLAGLLVMATRANHGAYVRTQVTYMAQNMADRMSANPIAVWSGNYNSDSYPVSTSGMQDCAAGCTPAQLATHDQQLWSRQLDTFLPNPQATITCSNAGLGYDPVSNNQVNKRPPYGGSCHMTIQWSDRGTGGRDDRDTEPQTFAWEFQP